MRKLIFLTTCLVLAGCAAKYIPPADGPTARVKYEATGYTFGQVINIHSFSNEACDDDRAVGVLKPRSGEDPAFEVTVRAGLPLINTLMVYNITRLNYITTKFTPREGREYLVLIDSHAGVIIAEMVNGKALRVDSVEKPAKVCLGK
jgi:hypothetical protein